MSRTPKSRALRGRRPRRRHRDEWYVEPLWVSERLFEAERFDGQVWDPACGMGRIVDAAAVAGLAWICTDLVDRGRGGGRNFLAETMAAPNIVCNPPFKIAEAFVAHALRLATCKVAMLLPAGWLHGDTRSRWLETTPLRRVWFLAPRPSIPPGTAKSAVKRPRGGFTDFAWFVWLQGYDGQPEVRWLRREADRARAAA